MLAIFGGGGFCVTYAIYCLLASKPLGSVDALTARSRPLRLARDIVAVVLVLLTLTFSGPVVQSGGYGGWLVALFLGVTCPLVICLVTYHFAVLLGSVAAASVIVSAFLANPDHHGRWFQPSAWAGVSSEEMRVGGVAATFLVLLSLAVSVPIAVRRRHITSTMKASSSRLKSI